MPLESGLQKRTSLEISDQDLGDFAKLGLTL